MEQFKSVEEYYSTAFHEAGHSTMKRLGRDVKGFFGDEEYSKEEADEQKKLATNMGAIEMTYCDIVK